MADLIRTGSQQGAGVMKDKLGSPSTGSEDGNEQDAQGPAKPEHEEQDLGDSAHYAPSETLWYHGRLDRFVAFVVLSGPDVDAANCSRCFCLQISGGGAAVAMQQAGVLFGEGERPQTGLLCTVLLGTDRHEPFQDNGGVWRLLHWRQTVCLSE